MHRSTLIGSAVACICSRAASRPKPPASDPPPERDPGLYLICAIELCERLGSAMVFALLVFYLNEYLGLGAGWSARASSYLHMLAYAAGILGGMLGDRRLGARYGALVGSALMALGYGLLGLVQRAPAGLLVSALLIVAGNGFFKPNCTALLGALYTPWHPWRATAFYWFYYAINLGAMWSPCLGGLMRTALGWGAMFYLAAGFVGLALGLLALGGPCLNKASSVAATIPLAETTADASMVLGAPATSRPRALVFVMAVLAIFGAVLSQGHGTLLLWVRDDARRSLFGHVVPPDFFASLPAVFVLIFGPLLARLTKALAARGVSLGDASKFTAGMVMCAVAYGLMLAASVLPHGSELASPLWLVGCKVALAIGELLGVPVAVALAESLAPSRTKGLTLGLSYGSHALGFWLGGEVSALWHRCSHAVFFALLAGSCAAAATAIHFQAWRLTQAVTSKT